MNKHFCSHPLCPLRGTAHTADNDNIPEFADDVVRTASKIALYMFGDASMTRRVYHLAGTSNMPFHKQGSVLCIRRSALDRFIVAQEERLKNNDDSKRQ